MNERQFFIRLVNAKPKVQDADPDVESVLRRKKSVLATAYEQRLYAQMVIDRLEAEIKELEK